MSRTVMSRRGRAPSGLGGFAMRSSSLKRTRDGKTWEVVQDMMWGGGVAAGSRQILHASESGWFLSSTQGKTWAKLTEPLVATITYPRIFRTATLTLVLGYKGTGLGLSHDQGTSWEHLKSFAFEHGNDGFAEGNGALVAIGTGSANGAEVGYAARSSDRGKTWTVAQVTAAHWSSLIFDGKKFVAWAGARMWSSVDGAAWTSAPVKVDGKDVPAFWYPVAAHNAQTGSYAAVLQVGGFYYKNQAFYRSTDGANWSSLPVGSFRGGHPIMYMTTAELDRSACP
jgi:hypothetical protein